MKDLEKIFDIKKREGGSRTVEFKFLFFYPFCRNVKITPDSVRNYLHTDDDVIVCQMSDGSASRTSSALSAAARCQSSSCRCRVMTPGQTRQGKQKQNDSITG